MTCITDNIIKIFLKLQAVNFIIWGSREVIHCKNKGAKEANQLSTRFARNLELRRTQSDPVIGVAIESSMQQRVDYRQLKALNIKNETKKNICGIGFYLSFPGRRQVPLKVWI